MIFYGSKASTLGGLNITGTECIHCNNQDTQRVVVFGKYAHIYWIPLFPIGKTAVSECSHCLKTIEQKEFPPALKAAYDQKKSELKRPFWHWIGSGIIGLFAFMILVAGIFAEVDPRDQFLKEDIKQLSSNPTMEADSVSFMMKQFFNDFVNEEVEPESFEYLTKVNGEKVLILIKVPTLKQVEKDERQEVIKMVEMVADAQEDLKDKEKYIAIHGKYNLMMAKSPAGSDSGNLISGDLIYDFYGPKPAEL